MSSNPLGASSIYVIPKLAKQKEVQTPLKPTCASYKDAYDAVISRRCRNVLAVHLVLSLLFTILFQITLVSPLSFLNWKTITHTVLLFLFSAPLYLIRITLTKLWQPIPPSRCAELLAKVAVRDHWYMVAAYSFSGLLIIQLYLRHLMEEPYSYKMFAFPHGDRFGMRQLNQDYLFICVYGIMLGIAFATRLISKDQWVLVASPVQQPKAITIKQSLGAIPYDAVKMAALVFAGTYTCFVLLSGSMYQLALYLFSTFWTVLDTPVIGFSWHDLYLFTRVFLGGFLAVLSWEMIDQIYNAFFAVTEAITPPFENAHACLLTGLRNDSDPLLKGTAFAELAYLAAKSPTQRKALFCNMGTDLNNTAWIEVSRECMKVLSKMCEDIEKEYTVGKKSPPAPPAPKAAVEPVPTNRIKLIDANVFATPKTNTILLDDRTGDWFARTTPITSSVATFKNGGINAPKEQLFKLVDLALSKLEKNEWIRKECLITIDRKIRQVFTNYPLLVSAIQALGSLMAASVQEDPFRLVQQDLELVLNRLLASVTNVERIIRSPPAEYKMLAPGYLGEVIMMEPEMVLFALREAIYQIVTAYEGHLHHIKVDSKYAAKWQQFVDFRE
ncbi:nucleoporin protein Ndc1-Nup [Dichotomocladium elegans]|nr:nucleoporin protein Ndc1-Nup [Dichotomocladium elegans]